MKRKQEDKIIVAQVQDIIERRMSVERDTNALSQL